MTKTLIAYLLKIKGEERIVVGTKKENDPTTNQRFKMKEGCILKVNEWDGKGEIQDWIKNEYLNKKPNEILHYAFFAKENIQTPEPYYISL